MPVSLSLKHDIDRAKKRLTDIERRQIPFAIVHALTLTVKDAQKEIRREMPRVFDRPTKRTIASVGIEPARKSKPFAAVEIEDQFTTGIPAEKWLSAGVRGGRRKHKRFERALIASGHMPMGKFAAPSRRLRLDRYGNVPKGMHTKIMSALRSGIDSTQYRAQGSGARFFALPNGRGRLPAGIYQRKGVGGGSFITLIFAFVSPPRYRKRLRFWRIADDTARTRMPINFRKALRRALRTARR